jgi:ankyrin repeat protein
MNKKKLSVIFFSILAPCFMYAMEEESSLLPPLLPENIYSIISLALQPSIDSWKPVKELSSFRLISKYFCTLLTKKESSIPSIKIMHTVLQLPLMHCAALANNREKIIKLKLLGHCIRQLDSYNLKPSDYAQKISCQKSLKVLGMGDTYDKQKYFSKHVLAEIQNKNPSSPRYTKNDVTKAIINENYEELITMLSKDKECLPLLNMPIVYPPNENIKNLCMYTQQCKLELQLQDALLTKKELTDDFFAFFNHYKANPNSYTDHGIPFIHNFIVAGLFNETFKRLIEVPTLNLNLKDHHGLTPIAVCAKHGRNAMLLYLLEKINPDKKNPLSWENSFGLCTAAQHNHEECFKTLLDYKANYQIQDNHGKTAMHYAASNTVNTSFVKKLYELAPLLIMGKTYVGELPIDHAIQVNSEKNFELLFSYNPHLHTLSNGSTVIHTAAQYDSNSMLTFFIKLYPHLVDAVDSEGFTPLHVAVINQHPTAVNTLIHNGARINSKNNKGETPLHYAASQGSTNMVHVLIGHKALINEQSNENNNTDTVDFGSFSALHYAAYNGHKDTIIALLEYGANQTLVAHNGFTASQIGVQQKHLDCMTLFTNK